MLLAMELKILFHQYRRNLKHTEKLTQQVILFHSLIFLFSKLVRWLCTYVLLFTL